MGLIADIKANIKSMINYSDPLGTLTKVVKALGIPEKYIGIIEPYCYNKANNEQWINGVINLLTTYQMVLRDPFYDYFDFDEKLAYVESQFPTAINPLTGQPYGFGSADLETGEVIEDGVIINTIDNTIKRVEPTTTKNNNLIIFGALALGGVIYKNLKNKKNR